MPKKIMLDKLALALESLGLTSEASFVKSAFINEAKIIVNKAPGYISVHLHGKTSYGERVLGDTSAYPLTRILPERNLVNGKPVWHQDRSVDRPYIGLGYGRDMMCALHEALASEGAVGLSHGDPSDMAKDNNSNKLGPGFKVTRVCIVRYEGGVWLLAADFDNIMTLLDDNVWPSWDDYDKERVIRNVKHGVWNAVSEDYYTMPSYDLGGSGIKIETGLMIEWAGAKSSIPVKLDTEHQGYAPPSSDSWSYSENAERDEKVRQIRYGEDK